MFFVPEIAGNESQYSVGSFAAFLFIVIIVIIKIGRQCKAEREWYTPYQSEDPSPTIPTYRQKEEKGKKSRKLK